MSPAPKKNTSDSTHKAVENSLGDVVRTATLAWMTAHKVVVPEGTPLCEMLRGKSKATKKMRSQRALFVAETMDALLKAGKLPFWNVLLRAYGMKEVKSEKDARKAFKTIYVNLWDLLEGRFDRTFPSLAALSRDCKKPGRCFPREAAKKANLQPFLRHLM